MTTNDHATTTDHSDCPAGCAYSPRNWTTPAPRITLKPYDINGTHLGKKLRVTNGEGYELTDTLAAVHHEADLIDDRKLTDAQPRWAIGRWKSTLTFINTGQMELGDVIELEVIE